MPIFVYVFGLPMKTAVPMSLGVVGVTSLVGAAGHWRRGNVRVSAALTFAPAAMLGTLGGARLATLVSGRTQLILFGLIMGLAAMVMFRGQPPPAQTAPPPRSLVQAVVRILPVGLGVGVVTGLVGVGGGFLIVPALVILLGLPIHAAVGTSLLVIALNSAAGVVGYLDQGELQWATMAGFTAVALVGVVVGGRLSGRVPAERLRRGFAIFLVAMAAFILLRNLWPGAA